MTLPENAPYTDEVLSDDQLAEMGLPDQIRYLVYSGEDSAADVAAQTTDGDSWSLQMVDDMLYDDDLAGDDENLRIPEEELPEREETESESDPEEDEQEELPEFEELGEEELPQCEEAETDGGAVAEPAGAEVLQPEPLDSVTEDDTLDEELATEPQTQHPEPEETGGSLPVDRDYDWSDYKLDPDEVPEYISADGEYEDIVAETESRHVTGKLPHFRITGPTGCGKTTLPENVAVDLDAPVFEINCHDGLRPNNLLGMPTYVGDETWWVDGPLTKALLSSQEQPTVLILDEVNRTTARTLGVLMSALDHQCRVTLNSRGGEVVEGNALDLLVFSTMNEGSGYVVNKLDLAQIRRFGNEYPTDYIGVHDPAAEAELVAERTPVAEAVASKMVSAANEVREKANEKESDVDMGIPTSTMLDWARTAYAYKDMHCSDGPLVKAAQRSVISPYYAGNETAENVVETAISNHVEGMPVDYGSTDLTGVDGVGEHTAASLAQAGYGTVSDLRRATVDGLQEVDGVGEGTAEQIKADVGEPQSEEEGIAASDDLELYCTEGTCTYFEPVEEADETVTVSMTCPVCASDLQKREA